MIYAFLYVLSFLGSKYLGIDKTLHGFRKWGQFLRKIFRFSASPEQIEINLKKSLRWVPFAAKCLDQAIITWFALNLNGHRAVLRIGLSITPLESHAWVVLGEKIFVDTYNIQDLKVVAEYPAWDDS
jgi:hypothetical protein